MKKWKIGSKRTQKRLKKNIKVYPSLTYHSYHGR